MLNDFLAIWLPYLGLILDAIVNVRLAIVVVMVVVVISDC